MYKDPCKKCGEGSITTDAAGSTTPDDCYLPPGHFTTRADDGVTLIGAPCPAGSYGRSNKTYGLQVCMLSPLFSS